MTASLPLVPVKTGALRSSGEVGDVTHAGGIAMVEIGYGGAASAYAVIVHEDLTKRHPNGMAKFLEAPMLAAQPRFQKAMEREIVRIVGRAS